jgi:hypothetical protein
MSIDPRDSDLINRVIDGDASTEERAALRARIAAHPETRDEFALLERLSSVLGRIEDVEPPLGFKAGVLAALPAERKGGLAPVVAIRRSWGDPRRLLQYGYALAAGLVLGVALTHWNGTGSQDVRGIDPSVVAGTMTSRQAASAAPFLAAPLESPRAAGTVEVRKAEAGYLIALDLDAKEPVEVVLGYEEKTAAFRGFAQDIDAVHVLEVADGRISWKQTGHRRTTVVMTPRGADEARVDLKIYIGGAEAGGRAFVLPGS